MKLTLRVLDMYLINPPEDALHTPVPPSKIVFAGDSAGAGLCLTALTVIRDLGIELPAGAVLISPWVDMTHSFPSVMSNTTTVRILLLSSLFTSLRRHCQDIIPPHGFIHKPSPIWPPEPAPKDERSRVIDTQTNPPPEPGHPDTLNPSSRRLHEQVNERLEKTAEQNQLNGDANLVHTADLTEENVQTQSEMLQHTQEYQDINGGSAGEPASSNSGSSGSTMRQGSSSQNEDSRSLWEPKPPKVLMKDPDARPLELRGQIQLYATNE